MNCKLHNEIVKLENEKNLFKRIIDYIVLCAMIFCDIFIRNKKLRRIGISIDDSYSNIKDLEDKTTDLLRQIDQCQFDIQQKNLIIKELELKLETIEKELCIENRYMDILLLLQHLDTWVDALPEEVNSFKKITKVYFS